MGVTPTTAVSAQASEPGKGMWPSAPVVVSKTEGVIEVFWDSEYRATTRWTLAPRDADAQLAPSWDQVMIHWKPKVTGETLELQRPYDLDVSGYRRLILRARTRPDIRTTVLAVVDGRTAVIARDVPGQLSTLEIAGDFQGAHLDQVKVVFSATTAEPLAFELRWIMVDKPGIAWDPPKAPFDGMIVEKPVDRFKPGIGLLFSATDVATIRKEFSAPSHAAVARVDCALAARQAGIDPASLVRRYALYPGGRGRYDREADAAHDFNNDGLTLACVGLMTGNEEYMRLAAKHAVVFARMEHWSEGFVDRFPDSPFDFGWSRPWRSWRHTGFAPNVASIQVSLLLDLAWNWLTPAGRQLILTALREKGIPYFTPFLPPRYGANQGARFTKGYLLARMATAPSISDPVLQAEMRQLLNDFNASVAGQTREDGTFHEEGYGQSVMENIAATYHAFSRCLQQPTRELVPPRMRQSMRFMLDSDRTVSAHLAAFGAGPLGDTLFAAYCRPAHLTSGWNPENHGYGLESIWYPASQAGTSTRRSAPFSAYPDGGWVFMGNDNPTLPRVSLESGFWAPDGHIWKHKNAVTLDAFGETLLLTRQYAGYEDVRCAQTARAAAYNTFTPGERDMDLNPSGAHGARLILAQDLGPAALAVSDAASAWNAGVRKALRRVILLRPDVLIVDDTAEFDADEPGLQSWNSLGEWKTLDNTSCEVQVGKAKARLTVITPQAVQIRLAEDSIHLERLSGAERVHTGRIYRERAVHRAAFTSPAARQHRMLTIIQVFDAQAQEPASRITVVGKSPLIVEIAQGTQTARIADGQAAAKDLWGWKGDGEWLLAVRNSREIIATHAF